MLGFSAALFAASVERQFVTRQPIVPTGTLVLSPTNGILPKAEIDISFLANLARV